LRVLGAARAFFSGHGHFSDFERPQVPPARRASQRAVEVVLSRRVEFRGLSGASYSFIRLEDEASMRPIGVTYVIAVRDGQAWRLLRVGHTNNLAERAWAATLEDVRVAHPAAEVLIRLNVSRSIREAEAADLEAARA
jgi:hypothetical protein